MKRGGRGVLFAVVTVAALGAAARDARAGVSVTGFANPKYLITGSPVLTTGDGVLKMIFEKYAAIAPS
jgi:hypothetical protein